MIAVGLAGCTPIPRPVPELSPLAIIEKQPLYLPIVAGNDSYDRGVGLTYGKCADAEAVNASWYINWGVRSSGCTNATHVPVVWGDFKECPVRGPGPRTVGFNEPSRKDQSNLTPNNAAELWYRLTVECASERQFATPSAVNDLAWLTEWWLSYTERYGMSPRADVVNVHCYASNADACTTFLKSAIAWGKARGIHQVLVSEYAILPCSTDVNYALAEAEKLTSWMDSQPEIIGYAWFAARITGSEWWALRPQPQCNTALVTEAGQLTEFGVWYGQ